MDDRVEAMACGYFIGTFLPAGCRDLLQQMRRLAQVLHDRHYPSVAGWKPAEDFRTVILQVDNMTAGLAAHPRSIAEQRVIEAVRAWHGYYTKPIPQEHYDKAIHYADAIYKAFLELKALEDMG